MIDELRRILAERENSMAARLHRVVIVSHAENFPSRGLISRLKAFVPRVDFTTDDELSDLL